MGKIYQRSPVKLINGFIYKKEVDFTSARDKLVKIYGDIDFESQKIEFDHTDYYVKEMGGPLYRKFICFKKLINAANLPDIKIHSNDLEEEYYNSNQVRQINLDPGYISASKLILATTKNHQQRIYLNKGIYGENELYFQDGTFKFWDWSYPDYKTQTYRDIFIKIRKMYAKQIKELDLRFI